MTAKLLLLCLFRYIQCTGFQKFLRIKLKTLTVQVFVEQEIRNPFTPDTRIIQLPVYQIGIQKMKK